MENIKDNPSRIIATYYVRFVIVCDDKIYEQQLLNTNIEYYEELVR